MISASTYFEIGTTGAQTTVDFFSKVFTWTFHSMGRPGEGWFDSGAIRIGVHGEDPAHQIVPYFCVMNINAAVAAVRSAGGSVDSEISSEEGFGRFVNCRDPLGVAFGLHESNSPTLRTP